MDYEVFLLSRIKERYEEHGDNRRAVAEGLASSAGTISSAALIMVAVFAVFVLTGVPSIKELGLGNAVAIALDATLVRLVLVPAAMQLMGTLELVAARLARPGPARTSVSRARRRNRHPRRSRSARSRVPIAALASERRILAMGLFDFLRRKDERAIPEPGTPEFEAAVRGSAIPDSRSVSMGESGWTSTAAGEVERSSETIDLRGSGHREQVEEVLREHGIDPDKQGQTVDASKVPGLQKALFSVLWWRHRPPEAPAASADGISAPERTRGRSRLATSATLARSALESRAGRSGRGKIFGSRRAAGGASRAAAAARAASPGGRRARGSRCRPSRAQLVLRVTSGLGAVPRSALVEPLSMLT